MVAVVLGSAVVFLDTSVVNLALPSIGADLATDRLGTLEAQTYVTAGYFVTLSALLIVGGGLTDRLGRRRMFSWGLAGFAATSLLCGVAPTMEVLIVSRMLQGAAGALVVPGSLSIITASFDDERRGRAFGVWAGASAATTILGPFVGGVLVNTVSWRAVFLLNLPLLAVAWYATVRYVPESRDEEASGRLDWLGSVVVILAVGGLAFGTIRGQEHGWSSPSSWISLLVGAVALVALPFLMLRRPDPLVPPKLFRSRNFTVTNLSTLVIYGALYVSLMFQGLFLIEILGYNEQAAGLAGIPSSILLVLFSTRFGGLAARHGPRLFMAAGPAIMAVGLLWFVRIPSSSEAWVLGTGAGRSILPSMSYVTDILPAMLVFGAGLTMMVAPLTTALMTSVPERNAGVASAVNNAISRVGSPLVTAVIFLAVASSFYASIADRVDVDTDTPAFRAQVEPLKGPSDEDVSPDVQEAATEASTDAFRLAVLVSAALLATGAAVNGLGIRNPSRAPESPGSEGA